MGSPQGMQRRTSSMRSSSCNFLLPEGFNFKFSVQFSFTCTAVRCAACASSNVQFCVCCFAGWKIWAVQVRTLLLICVVNVVLVELFMIINQNQIYISVCFHSPKEWLNMIQFLSVLCITSQCKQQVRNINYGSSFLIRQSHENYDSAYRSHCTVQLK